MSRLIQPLLFLFARCTKNELIRQIEFLKAENELLRSRVSRQNIILKPAERNRLIELGKGLGTKLNGLITVVTYDTFRKWLRDGGHVPPGKSTPGRPKTLWQCDFFSNRIWTWKGRKQFFALAFLHLGTRRVFVTPSTMKPNGAWLRKQTEAFIEYAKEQGVEPGYVTRDGDFVFQHGFDDTLKSAGFTPKRLMYRSPNLNAYVERWVQSIQQEALDHFLVFGEQHFNHLISEYVDDYNTERPHQALENRPLTGEWPEPEHDKPPEGEIVCHSRLGGWLKTYERMAA
jgi:putative transposase